MEFNGLCFILVFSWFTLPTGACFILALHFIIGISGVLLYIIIGVFSVGLLAIVIIATVCYVKETYEPFMCARYIALCFICLLVLFFIGYVISSIVYFFIDSENPTSSALSYIGLMAPYCFLMCSLGYLVQMPERGF